MPKKKPARITSVKKGDLYETKTGQLLEVTNGRLKVSDQGTSFEGRQIEFDLDAAKPAPAETTDRYYLDELAKKLSKNDYAEWIAAGEREAEGIAAAKQPAPTPAPKPKTSSPPASGPKPHAPMSQLDAAVKVLSEAGQPMTAKAMVQAMADRGYWTSPGGKTPHATLYSACLREITQKGIDSRFAKADRGHFTLNKEVAR